MGALSNLPKRHGFLTPAERDYIALALEKYPELAGTKKLRHDFKLKLSPWLIEELFQTMQDWSTLSDYFVRFEDEQQQRDLIRNSIWQMDDDTRLLIRFIKDWIPEERMGELVSWLMADLHGSSGEPPRPVNIIHAQRDYLRRLRFVNLDVSISEFEEKRLAALKAVNDLFCYIDGKNFILNNEYDRTSKVHTNTAYQIDLNDVKAYEWFMKKNHTLRLETEKLPDVPGVGKDVKISWNVDFPKALLFLIDSGACKNCFQMIERIRKMMVYEPDGGVERGRKILLLKKDGRLDATFINEVRSDLRDTRYGPLGLVRRDEIASLLENAEKLWDTWWEPFGPVCLDEPISKLRDIVPKQRPKQKTGEDRFMKPKSRGDRFGILGIQSKMSDELGLLQKRRKSGPNRPTFNLTKKGKRISRLLTIGKEKERPIECILSFTNEDGIRQKVPILGGDAGNLGLGNLYPDDC